MTNLSVHPQKNKENAVRLHSGILLIHEHHSGILLIHGHPVTRGSVEEVGSPGDKEAAGR